MHVTSVEQGFLCSLLLSLFINSLKIHLPPLNLQHHPAEFVKGDVGLGSLKKLLGFIASNSHYCSRGAQAALAQVRIRPQDVKQGRFTWAGRLLADGS